MKIKLKLTFGVGLLFVLIILLAAVSIRYVNGLKSDTENILTANYNTLQYARNMLISLEEFGRNPQAAYDFGHNLEKQKGNVTEIGEDRVTGQVGAHFEALRQMPQDSALRSAIRRDIAELMEINMLSIEKKSGIANQTAESAVIWISLTGTLCFLIAFTLLVNLPGSIANPIEELTGSIQAIAAQRYHQRVHFESHSEFGALARSFNTMAEKLEEYANSKLEKILKENKRIETLISNIHDPIIGIDEEKKVLFINDEALNITGLRRPDALGRTVRELSVGNDLIRMLARDLLNPENGAGEAKPIKIFADRKESYFEKEIIEIRILPTGEETYQSIGHFIWLRNITPFKELDFAKTNFIATVSHELKTPISSIQLSLDLLDHKSTGELNSEQHKLVESIREDNVRLLKITRELLNMSQVETGNIQLKKQYVLPEEIVGLAVDATRGQAEQKRVLIRRAFASDLPVLNVDQEKTAWVLINFITNAIKHSAEGGEILLTLRNTDNTVTFSVRDYGPGIEAGYRSRVFERYFQIPGGAKGGTGLGLSISKDFIESQGGTIGVDSTVGEGSTFYFSFPV
ncbi:ATP-binding protein [Ravibacter arvi]|uniref:histidine kinase n=1 Tax=Ravibacter arvi TaxID=2051041 RepID=A0ABP8LVD0_9BACT